MPERNTDVLEILIRQMAEYGNVNFILGKALRILPETKLPKPVRNLLHQRLRADQSCIGRIESLPTLASML